MNTKAITARDLNNNQRHAIASLGSVMKYRSATDLQIAPATLQSLVRLGLVEEKAVHVQSSNPRSRVSNEPVLRSYRNSMLGYRIAREMSR